MSMLAGLHYDPAAAVSKSCAALLAMTAFDTTNLRLSFTVPADGRVLVRIACTMTGATTAAQILLGVLEGATVRGRHAPISGVAGTLAATTLVPLESVFLVTGLVPGAVVTWDAAYGVETLVSGCSIKYGGPNDATANDAFGGFSFSVWGVA